MNDDGRTDAALLAAGARGDEAAFATLVRRYIRPATLLAAQIAGDRDSAEDIVQDAFIAIYRAAGRFDERRPFAPWCFAIVRRLANNRRTRERRRARLAQWWGRGDRQEPRSPEPERRLVAGLDAAVTERALTHLSPMQRACFVLIAVRGLSPDDVAAMYGITASTVRQHTFRARAALRAALGEDVT